MGWSKGCRDQESGQLRQGFLMNNCVLDDYEKSKNKLPSLSQKADSQKRDKTSLTLTEDEAECGQCPGEDHLECWGRP